LKRDLEYKFKEELCGCRLTNEKYFTSCTMILDEEWDNINTCSGIDVCIVTGECDTTDTGKNEILLAARIYVDGYQIPDYPKEELNLFFETAQQFLGKNGYEVFRRGGSGGYPVPDQDLLDFHREYKASLPVIAGAAVHMPMSEGNWLVTYISPYRDRISESVATITYSPPHPGGQLRKVEDVFRVAPDFFLRMAATRWTLPHILQALYLDTGTVISPIARDNQQMYNTIAFQNVITTLSGFENMINQVRYSFVPYTVGSHKDMTAAVSPQEFIECKALLKHPKKSTSCEHQTIALGRGGFGGGIYGCMIVDHPEKP
jgi:hypothetical protein